MDFKASQVGVPTFSTQAQDPQAPGTHHHRKAKPSASPGEASQALTVQPASSPIQSEHGGFHFSWAGILAFVIGFGLPLYGIYRLVRWISKKARGGYEEADYSVPHCKFQETPEGFIVTFRKMPGWMQGSIFASIERQNSGGGGLAHVLGLFISVLLNITVGLVVWIWLLFFPTKIEITRDTVIVAGKKLRRADFGVFSIDHTRQVAIRDSLATLGYSYGNRSYKITGAWTEREAQEIASALNSHLRSVPQAGDENRPSQEALRQAARPADF